MAKPNYSFAKHQREIAKKKKQEDKRQRKADAKQAQAPSSPVPETLPAPAAPDAPPPACD